MTRSGKSDGSPSLSDANDDEDKGKAISVSEKRDASSFLYGNKELIEHNFAAVFSHQSTGPSLSSNSFRALYDDTSHVWPGGANPKWINWTIFLDGCPDFQNSFLSCSVKRMPSRQWRRLVDQMLSSFPFVSTIFLPTSRNDAPRSSDDQAFAGKSLTRSNGNFSSLKLLESI